MHRVISAAEVHIDRHSRARGVNLHVIVAGSAVDRGVLEVGVVVGVESQEDRVVVDGPVEIVRRVGGVVEGERIVADHPVGVDAADEARDLPAADRNVVIPVQRIDVDLVRPAQQRDRVILVAGPERQGADVLEVEVEIDRQRELLEADGVGRDGVDPRVIAVVGVIGHDRVDSAVAVVVDVNVAEIELDELPPSRRED